MRLFLKILALVLVSGGIYYFQFYGAEGKYGRVSINENEYRVEVADTKEKQTRGLQNRKDIGSDGMVFVFERPGLYSFWMKDVQFPLDFVWINSGRVIGLHESVPVSSVEPHPTYSPPEPVTHVLELSVGQILKGNIKVGDEVKIDI